MKTKCANRAFALLLSVLLILFLASCGTAKNSGEPSVEGSPMESSSKNSALPDESTPEAGRSESGTGKAASISTPSAESEQDEHSGELSDGEMKTMKITVGSTSFTAQLYDNETTRALLAKLPLTVDMTELNGREKYYHLPEDLPTESTEQPATIHAGEIMCWSSNSLVLFYNTFANSYGGYVKLGVIEDASDLASALGTGNVRVTFEIDDQ